MSYMFYVRSARALGPQPFESRAPSVHAVAAASYPLSRLPARASPPIIYTPPFRLRQDANSLSAANKLLIRCAWVGTAAFDSAGYVSSWAPYVSGWAPGSCA